MKIKNKITHLEEGVKHSIACATPCKPPHCNPGLDFLVFLQIEYAGRTFNNPWLGHCLQPRIGSSLTFNHLCGSNLENEFWTKRKVWTKIKPISVSHVYKYVVGWQCFPNFFHATTHKDNEILRQHNGVMDQGDWWRSVGAGSGPEEWGWSRPAGNPTAGALPRPHLTFPGPTA